MKLPSVLLAAAFLVAAGYAEADGADPQLPANITAPKPANVHAIGVDDYPTISRAMHEEGTVTLSITITEDGRVTDAKVDKSSGFPRLDQAAAEVVMRDWLYKPATRDGKPMTVHTKVNVVFKERPPDLNLAVGPQMPFIVFRMGPKDYPASALAQKEEAVVLLMVVVNEEGKIVDAHPAREANFPDLEQASVNIAKSWQVKPAEMNGKPVRTLLSPIFVWTLSEPQANTAQPASP